MATDSGQQDDGSAALAPFGSVEYCPKCGAAAHDSNRRWMCKESVYGEYGMRYTVPEHLAITCGTCGYLWKEAPKDAEGKA